MFVEPAAVFVLAGLFCNGATLVPPFGGEMRCDGGSTEFIASTAAEAAAAAAAAASAAAFAAEAAAEAALAAAESVVVGFLAGVMESVLEVSSAWAPESDNHRQVARNVRLPAGMDARFRHAGSLRTCLSRYLNFIWEAGC